MNPFQYYEPETLEGACLLLSKFGKEARILAGGTDLLVQMRKGSLAPGHVINIKKIKDLDFIRQNSDGYRLGALATISEIAAHDGLEKTFPIMVSSARSIGSAQIRNLATLGGNVCNASPSADMSPGLMVLEANLKVVGPSNSRVLPIADFLVGPGRVDLGEGEMVSEVIVPFPPENTKMIYYKLGPRKAMDCAVVSVAVAISLNGVTGQCERARIALGAVAPTPIRVREAEKLVEGRGVEEISLVQIAEAVRHGIAPITDVRGSAEYRYDTAATLTVRAVQTLISLC